MTTELTDHMPQAPIHDNSLRIAPQSLAYVYFLMLMMHGLTLVVTQMSIFSHVL